MSNTDGDDDMFALLDLIDDAWKKATAPIIEAKERRLLDEKRLAELERRAGCNDY